MAKTPERLTSQDKGVRELRRFYGMKEIILKTRECMNCKKEFKSEGAGHRLCKYCDAYAQRIQTQEDAFY